VLVAGSCAAFLQLTVLGTACSQESEAYEPGLGEIMSLTSMRHQKLWFAGQAGNWRLAAYELDELQEGFADAVRFHPTHKDAARPLTELVPEFTAGPIESVRRGISMRDPAVFEAAFDALTAGCNGCHVAADFSFNVIVRPAANPFSNQSFGEAH